MSKNPMRKKRLYCLVWIICILLQQCREVLLMNVLLMQNKGTQLPNNRNHDNTTRGNFPLRSSNPTQKRNPKQSNEVLQDSTFHSMYLNTLERSEDMFSRLSRRSVASRNTEIDNVIAAVRNITKTFNFEEDYISKLKEKLCSNSESKQLHQFWETQQVAYTLYLLSSSVLACLASCHEVMVRHVEELVDNLGSEDAIELLEESVPIIKSSLEKADSDSNGQEEEDTSLFDPESPENRHLQHLRHVLLDSISNIHTFSSFFNKDQNVSSPQLVDAILEEKIEEAELEFDIMSSVLDAQPQRNIKKRSVESTVYRQETFLTSKEAALISFTSFSKEQIGTLYLQAVTIIDKANRHAILQTNVRKSKDVSQNLDSLKLRIRNHRSVDEYDSLVMIKNDNFPCKLLSVCGDKLCFKPYDDQYLTELLWIWENGYLQNMGALVYVSVNAETNLLYLQNEIPGQPFVLNNHRLFLGNNSNCSVTVQDNAKGQHAFKIACQQQAQTWRFTTFMEAKHSLASLACLFLIQDTRTCFVATPEHSNEMQFVAKSIDDNEILNQVWQWNHQYMRHYNTKLYLNFDSSGLFPWKMSLDETPTTNWAFENNTLHTVDSKEEAFFDINNEKVQLLTNSKRSVNLTLVNDLGQLQCESRGGNFAIKHTSEPCKVLCLKSASVGPDIIYKVIAISSGFVAGVLLGMTSIAFTEHNMSIKIAFGAGLILSVVTFAVVEYSTLFLKEYQTVQFQDFDDARPLSCLWNDYSGTLRSADNNKSFHVESASDGIYRVVRLSAETEQKWIIQNGNICSKSSTTCTINLKVNREPVVQKSDELLVSCDDQLKINSSWSTVYNDGSVKFREQIVCMFFLRQSHGQTCTFLTANGKVSDASAQTYSNKHLLNQVWYSKDGSLKNVETGISISENTRDFEKIPFDEESELMDVLNSCHRNMFYIQSEKFPCQLLTVLEDGKHFKLALQEYSIGKYFNQLWTSIDRHLYNIGTGTRIAISSNDSSASKVVISNSNFIPKDDCSIENNTIKFTASNCFLSETEVNGEIELHCKSKLQSSWNFIPFDENFTFLRNVICTFFIQNQNPPCAFLTANTSTKQEVFMEYMANDVIDSQIWFISDGRLVNFHSGHSLIMKPQGKELSLSIDESVRELKWTYRDFKLIERSSGEYLTGFVSVRLAAENEILIPTSKFWNVIPSGDMMNHLNNFTCQSSTQNVFFLKNQIRPCELLTALNDKHLSFEIFDESVIEKQLWYIENGRLFNVYTGNVITFVENGSRIFHVEQSEMLVYDTNQVVYTMQDKLVHVYNTSHECYFSYLEHSGNSNLTCQFTETKASEWKRVYFQEDMTNVDELLCIFFLRNKLAPCEYLTGYEENEEVKVRPRINELVETQLFYWKNNYVRHFKTGLFLTASIGRSSEVALRKQSVESETFFQRWSALGSQIVPMSYNFFNLEVNTEIDGNVILTKSNCVNKTAYSQHWSEEPFHLSDDIPVKESEGECVEERKRNSVFFIRSKMHPCNILSGNEQGNTPRFEVFEMDDIERFLWIHDSHHIINNKTGLVLMMEFDEVSSEQEVIMWQSYAFSLAQKWIGRKDGFYYSGLHSDCFLHSESTDLGITLQAKCAYEGRSDLEMVLYDEDADSLGNLTCTFFVKSNAQHCELLTHIGGNKIRTRPLLPDQILHQLWYWNGNKLVNYGNNGVLVVKNSSSTVMLTENNNTRYGYLWSYSNSFLRSLQIKDMFISISPTDGEVVIEAILQNSNQLQQWIRIEKDDPASLACNDTHRNNKLYVLRSEHDSCPLLSAERSGSIGVAKKSSSLSNNGLWIKDNSHIINIGQWKSLTVKENVVRGTTVSLQQKFFYEKFQKWSTENEFIKSEYTNHSQYLTYSKSKVVMENADYADNDRQIWKWYTVEQIEQNDKLLRCSRCYNQGEETAAEVISYIPVISWLYNIGRSIAYGAKNCPDVAVASLVEGIVDIAFDVVVALSAGTASALAYGVKTGLKLGIKAGVNAVKTAIKSMIKVTLKSIKSNVIKFVRRGLTKTVKRKVTRLHLNTKSAAAVLKSRMVVLKSRLTRFGSMFRKKIRFQTLTPSNGFSVFRQSFKHTIEKVKSSLKKLPRAIQKKTKEKMKAFGNALADKAERTIKKAGDYQQPIDSLLRRCKRVVGDCFDEESFRRIVNFNEDLPNVEGVIKDDLQELNRQEVLNKEKGQVSRIGLKQDNKYIFKDRTDKETMEQSDLKPEYKPGATESERRENPSKNFRHTEQHLFKEIDEKIKKKCMSEKPCEVVLYTKLSPCFVRPPPAAETCLKYIVSKCKEWFENYSTKCSVAFKTFFSPDIFKSKVDEPLATIFGKPKSQNVFGDDILKDVIKYAGDLLDNLNKRKAGVADVLKFNDKQKEIFYKSVTDAIEASKKFGISSFWLNLFSRLDFGTVFKEIEFKDVDKQVRVMIRETLNVEAKKRMTVKSIKEMTADAHDAISFYRI